VEAANVSRLIAEAEENLKRGKELMRTGPAPKPQPPSSAQRPIRPLAGGEPVFDRMRSLDQRQMTPRQSGQQSQVR
jgi:hypothetical protein